MGERYHVRLRLYGSQINRDKGENGMTQAEQFFYDNAGYSYDPKTETQENGRLRCAQAMAEAEAYVQKHGLEYVWEDDQDGCIGCDCGSEECSCCTGESHETLCCLLKDPETGNVLASCGGICGVTAEYRRVMEAELALEAA